MNDQLIRVRHVSSAELDACLLQAGQEVDIAAQAVGFGDQKHRLT
jgi:hypothetical protein